MANSDCQESDMPQWKKDLIQRRRAQSKCLPVGKQGLVKLSRPSVLFSNSIHSGGGTAAGVGRLVSPIENHGVGLTGALQPNLTNNSSVRPLVVASTGRVTHIIASTKLCDTNKQITGVSSKMVQDSVVVKVQKTIKTMRTESSVKNGDCNKNGEAGVDSDSSEEFQYGPGIVNKLRSKYLSLTLRESNVKSRPSILRRSTSLDNVLDDGVDDSRNVESALYKGPKQFVSRLSDSANNPRPGQNRYRNATRGNDSIKRARSVETLMRYSDHSTEPLSKERNNISKESLNEDVVIIDMEGSGDRTTTDGKPQPHRDNGVQQQNNVENKVSFSYCKTTGQRINKPKRLTSFMDETERPPADLVKKNLKIFETSAGKRPKGHKPVGDVAAKVDKFKHIIEQDKNAKKPILKPKPVMGSTDKGKKRPVVKPPTPPKKTEKEINRPMSRTPTPDLTPKDSPVICSPVPPHSPSPTPLSVGKLSTNLIETEQTVTNGDVSMNTCSSPEIKQRNRFIFSPKLASPAQDESSPPKPEIQEQKTITPKNVTSSPIDDDNDNDEPDTKLITKRALENISNAGTTMKFAFADKTSPVSHLPNFNGHSTNAGDEMPLKNVCHAENTSKKPMEINGTAVILEPLRIITQTPIQPQTNKENVLKNNETVNSLIQNGAENTNQINNLLLKQSNKPTHLTNREIEKNLINRVKTLEQPVNKVTVSVKTAEKVSQSATESGRGPSRTGGGGLWDQKTWQQNTSIVFNFSNRKDVPDYIENDGVIRRVKREKPKPGESGIILLPDAPEDETCTDDDDWVKSLGGPPSPCDVEFENANILIDGKSSISKHPKQQKLKIQFNDLATQLFEYPSESSLLEECISSQTIPLNAGSIASVPTTSAPSSASSTPLGTSFSSYTPSKVVLSAEDFQLGVTRSSQSPTAPPKIVSPAPMSIEPEHLKPATESDTLAWGSATVPDLLF